MLNVMILEEFLLAKNLVHIGIIQPQACIVFFVRFVPVLVAESVKGFK